MSSEDASPPWPDRPVREARRQAMLASEIVVHHTGPMKTLLGLARQHPLESIALAFAAGLLAAALVTSRPE